MSSVQCFMLEATGEEIETREGVFTPTYRMPDGALTTLRDAPAGAMVRDGWSLRGRSQDDDPRALVVKLPDGDLWYIDGRASNCTRREDNEHHCWLRHGVPPLVTVDKEGGDTCAAGAGSIQSTAYHGFLRNGYLVDA